MAFLDHDLGPEGATRAPDRPVQRTQASPPLLDLQRLAGNAAVTQAVQSGTFLPVQREDDPAAMEEEEEKVQEEEEAGVEEEKAGEEVAAAEEEMPEEEKEE